LKVHSEIVAPQKLTCWSSEDSKLVSLNELPARDENMKSVLEKSQSMKVQKSKKHIRKTDPVNRHMEKVALEKEQPWKCLELKSAPPYVRPEAFKSLILADAAIACTIRSDSAAGSGAWSAHRGEPVKASRPQDGAVQGMKAYMGES